MKRNKKRLASILLTMVMAMTLFFAAPMAVYALAWSPTGSNEATVTIATGDAVSDIQDVIDDLMNGTDVSGTNPGLDQYTTIIVTGSKTDADEQLTLTIPAGVTVAWEATYNDTTAAGSFTGYWLMQISNRPGIFEVLAGGNISGTKGYDTIGISGGISSGNVIVNGGTVVGGGSSNTAIYNNGGNVTISAGTVQSINGYAVYTYGGGSLTVTGGSVIRTSALTGSRAIGIGNGTVKITGGTIDGGGGSAIYAEAGGAAAYLAGTSLLSTGTVLNASSGGMIVEVDTLSVPISRNGTSIGITTKVGGNTAIWNMSGAYPVIEFTLAGGSTRSIIWGTKLDDDPGTLPPPNPTPTPDPDNPGTAGGGTTSSNNNVPQTGDINNTIGWTVVLALVFLGILGLVMWRKRQRA